LLPENNPRFATVRMFLVIVITDFSAYNQAFKYLKIEKEARTNYGEAIFLFSPMIKG